LDISYNKCIAAYLVLRLIPRMMVWIFCWANRLWPPLSHYWCCCCGCCCYCYCCCAWCLRPTLWSTPRRLDLGTCIQSLRPRPSCRSSLHIPKKFPKKTIVIKYYLFQSYAVMSKFSVKNVRVHHKANTYCYRSRQ